MLRPLAKLTNLLYLLARRTNDVQVQLSGDPPKIVWHWVNKHIGRAMGRHIYWQGRKGFADSFCTWKHRRKGSI